MQFVNKRKELIDFLKDKFSGNIVIPSKRHICKDGTLGSIIYRWRIRSSVNVKPVLEALIPFLKIKKDRAQFLLEFINNFNFERGKISSIEKLADKERYYLKMIDFNNWKSFNNNISLYKYRIFKFYFLIIYIEI